MKFAFRPLGSIYELLVSKKASLRSLWAEPRFQPVMASGFQPYLEFLTKGLVSLAWLPRKRVLKLAISAEEGSRLGSCISRCLTPQL